MNNNNDTILTPFLSDKVADINSYEFKKAKEFYKIKENEAVFIYCLVENKVIYAEGWKNLIGIEDEKITSKEFIKSIDPDFIAPYKTVTKKSLELTFTMKTSILNGFSLMHYNFINQDTKEKVPVINRRRIYEANKQGVVKSFVSTFKTVESLKLGKIFSYGIFNRNDENKIVPLNINLGSSKAMNYNEVRIADLLDQGKNPEEIGVLLGQKKGVIEKIIKGLFIQFGTFEVNKLLSVLKENHIIPNPFKISFSS